MNDHSQYAQQARRVSASVGSEHLRERFAWLLLVVLSALVVLIALMGIFVGSSGVQSLRAVWNDSIAQQIVFDIRLPRSLGALLAGGLLGLAGCIAQGLFRNPLADPYLLGSSSGAAFGVAVVLTLTNQTYAGAALSWLQGLSVTVAAFVGAIVSVVTTLLLAKGAQNSLRLLLAGIVVGVVLGACSNILFFATPSLMQSMQSFLFGSTSFLDWQACFLMMGTLLFCLLAAWLLGRGLDGLALGQATARTLGLPLGVIQTALIGVLALATASAVAQTGLLAFVGLAAPHLVRSLVKVRHRVLIILSTLMGAVLLGGADILARWLWAPQELPVGIVTALLGGGYLLWLLRKRRTFVG